MKKITLLFTLLIALPIVSFGQTFNFNGTDEGWTASGSCTLVPNPTFLAVDLTGDGTNPAFGTTTAGVNATANAFVGVTIKNSDPAGPTLMRVSFPKTPSGRVYVNLDITNGDTDYKTYWFDLTNSNWTGTVDDFKIHFKNSGNTTYTVPTAGVTVNLDKVEFASVLPRVEKLVYEFNTNGDDEGWSSLVDATSNVTGGNLTVSPSAPLSAIAKVTNGVNSVNADANSHMHIVYKNLSADNNQLRIQFRSSVDNYVAYVGTNETINQSMSAFETLSIDLEAAKPTEWSQTAQDFQIAIRNTNNASNVSSAGDLVIDRIVFNNSTTLSIAELNASNVSIYPNPTNSILNIKGLINLSKVELFDITGKKVLETTQLINDQLNVSTLNSGIYLLKLIDTNNNSLVKKIIIE